MSSSLWKPIELFREGARNFFAATFQSLGLVLLAGVVAFGVTYSNTSEVQQILDSEKSDARLGGYTALVRAEQDSTGDPAPVSAAECSEFGDYNASVLDSYATENRGLATLESAPGVQFRLVAVHNWSSFRDTAVTWSAAAAPGPEGVALSQGLAEELGVVPGSSVVLEGSAKSVEFVLPRVPNEVFERSMFVPADPTVTSTSCWLEVHSPVLFTSVQAAASGAFSTKNAQLFVDRARPLRLVDVPAAIQERVTAPVWLGATVVNAVVALLLLWFRRSDVGLYKTLGMSRTDLSTTLFAEAGLCVASGCTLGAGLGLLYPTLAGSATYEAVAYGYVAGFRTLCLSLAATAAVVLLRPSGSAMEEVRDR